MINKLLLPISILWLLFSCKPEIEGNTYTENRNKSRLERTELKMNELLEVSLENNKIPRSEHEGEMIWATKTNGEGNMRFDWTLGFFPGMCWYMYEHSGDEKWKAAATSFQSQFEPFKNLTRSHDLGFVFNCSFGNGYRIMKTGRFKDVLVQAGNSLMKRFNPNVGCIQSWNVDAGWQSERGWEYPVIIDNMMNLELLFELSELTKDSTYREAAISHANKTMENHFREDNSSYHVIDYDPTSGEVRKKNTAQGYAHESAWARGQAWGLYGYVVCFRYTKQDKYLDQATKIADFILNHPELPKDGIPYWDFNAPDIPNTLRDVSAAAITASALVELNGYTANKYNESLEKIMNSLSSEKYFSALSKNPKFVLKHSVGSIPHGAEIDEPLVYADYYYIEALLRMKNNNSIDQSIANNSE